MAALISGFLFISPPSFAQIAAQVKKQEPFKAKGVITQVDPAAKTFFLKNEGGLELTYHADDSTEFEGSGLAELFTGDEVEVTYRYNENYEKIALSVKKPSKENIPVPKKSSKSKVSS